MVSPLTHFIGKRDFNKYKLQKITDIKYHLRFGLQGTFFYLLGMNLFFKFRVKLHTLK